MFLVLKLLNLNNLKVVQKLLDVLRENLQAKPVLLINQKDLQERVKENSRHVVKELLEEKDLKEVIDHSLRAQKKELKNRLKNRQEKESLFKEQLFLKIFMKIKVQADVVLMARKKVKILTTKKRNRKEFLQKRLRLKNTKNVLTKRKKQSKLLKLL